MTDQLISIVTTCYNAAPFILDTVESIIEQDYSNFEYIIVDDGSDDETLSILNQINDPRVKVIFAGRIGRGKALNMALEMATGEFIAIQDADDLSHPERLKIEVDLLSRPGIELIGAGQILFDGEQVMDWPLVPGKKDIPKYIQNVSDRLAYFNPISHTSVMMTRSLIEAVGGYTESRRNLFDWDLYLRVLSQGYFVYTISFPLVGKRVHSQQFFERKDRLTYVAGSAKLQIRGARYASNRWLPFLSVPVLFFYRMIPASLRMRLRKMMVKQ